MAKWIQYDNGYLNKTPIFSSFFFPACSPCGEQQQA